MRMFFAVMLFFGLASGVQAQGKGKGGGKSAAGPAQGAIVFTDVEKEYVVKGYELLTAKERPPGWPRGGTLPPGLRNKLQRGGKLPPGWLQKVTPFPQRIDKRMAIDPPNIRRGFVEGYIVIFDVSTEIVLDVFAL